MILGVGTDIVHIDAFEAQLDDRASVFVQETFTQGERQDSDDRAGQRPGRHLAARFAAKEAFIKAWAGARRGMAPSLAQVDMRQIEVVCDPYGRPGLKLHGEVQQAFGRLGSCGVHLSLSHDGPFAVAFVVVEQL